MFSADFAKSLMIEGTVCSACNMLIFHTAIELFCSIVGYPKMLMCHIYTFCINTHGFFPLMFILCLAVIKSLSVKFETGTAKRVHSFDSTQKEVKKRIEIKVTMPS